MDGDAKGQVDAAIDLRARLVVEAYEWLGTPYRHQASAKGYGADCLGLIRGLWRFAYGQEPETPPPYTPDWVERDGGEPLLAAATAHMIEKPYKALLPADMLLFRIVPQGPAKHCGLYVGEGRFLHAYSGQAVTGSYLSEWWRTRIVGVFAFPSTHGDMS